jgi:rfaE bifunctional protein nucleotidyltransferase chain/domain
MEYDMKLVFTNGCFDILHRGHVDCLQKARMMGDYLMVGLNSDSSVRRLKGPTRPINSELDRKFVLEALSCVDEVVIFDEDTPYELIKKVMPDVIVKGGDYKASEVVGADLCKVIVVPMLNGYSSTGVINAIKRQG